MRRDIGPVPLPFPRSAFYRGLRSGALPGTVREPGEPDTAFPWSERHLQCIWFDAALRPADLRSARGEPIAVEHPGRWNLEAGPDFLDATLTVGTERRTLRGDVEVHVHPRDWLQHGHAEDPAYRNVRLHVAFYPGELPPGALPAGAEQASLAEPLRRAPGFSFEAVDVTGYPYARPPSSPAPCRLSLDAWSVDERATLLEAAGEERLRLKAERFLRAWRDEEREQTLYEETLGALGYKHNRLPFRRLARTLRLADLRREAAGDPLRAYALLLGVAGLMPKRPPAGADEETRAFLRRLWDHWWRRQAEWEPRAVPRGDWRLAGVRPLNHPLRRLAAAAALFADATDPLSRLLAADRSSPVAWLDHAARGLREAAALDYWRCRTSLASAPAAEGCSLLGEARIAALIANVFVPYLAASGETVAGVLCALPPEQDSSVTRQMAFTLFGPDHNPAAYRSGLRQQGLIQIFHDYCLANRSDCARCALPESLRSCQPANAGQRNEIGGGTRCDGSP
jgi:hypothetical protein